MNWVGYDIETSGKIPEYALQPWRPGGKITLSCMYSDKKVDTALCGQHQRILDWLVGKRAVTWNGIFDLAWLYAHGFDIRRTTWYDAMLLEKWLDNGQDTELQSRSLVSAAQRHLKDWPLLGEFVEMKKSGVDIVPGEDIAYWQSRVVLDAQATALIADRVWARLDEDRRRAATIQAMSLPTIAASWVNGVPVDLDHVRDSELEVVLEMVRIEVALGFLAEGWAEYITQHGPDDFKPSTVLSSPQQLAGLLYDAWGLPCSRFTTKTNGRAADKTALTYLADRDPRVVDILRWRELNTIRSKFINGPIKAARYLGSNIMHASPRVFSTYTGRMTYSSQMLKKPIGIPLHQMPRKKEIRRCVVAPPNHYIVEFDAAGQEMRGMAVVSKDKAMLELFNSAPPYDDGHSKTGAAISGIPFDEFLQRKAIGDPAITGPTGLRHAGKFCNLSMSYRAGSKTLRTQARIQYGLDITELEAQKWKKVYLDLYPGVRLYWEQAPKIANEKQYARTLAGRRYAITNWGEDDLWRSDSSSINFPIQAMGADQRDLAIAVLVDRFPHLWDSFLFDLHDGMYWAMPVDTPISTLYDIVRTLDNIDYKAFWGADIPVPLVWDCSFGPTWGDKAGLDTSVEGCMAMTLEEYYKQVERG